MPADGDPELGAHSVVGAPWDRQGRLCSAETGMDPEPPRSIVHSRELARWVPRGARARGQGRLSDTRIAGGR